MCDEEGKKHEFGVSKFFYESQGQRVPLKCEVHAEEDVTAVIQSNDVVTSLAVQKTGFWDRLKNAWRNKKEGKQS